MKKEYIRLINSDEQVAIEMNGKIIESRCQEDERSGNSSFLFQNKEYDDFDSFNHLTDQIRYDYLLKNKKELTKQDTIFFDNDKEFENYLNMQDFI